MDQCTSKEQLNSFLQRFTSIRLGNKIQFIEKGKVVTARVTSKALRRKHQCPHITSYNVKVEGAVKEERINIQEGCFYITWRDQPGDTSPPFDVMKALEKAKELDTKENPGRERSRKKRYITRSPIVGSVERVSHPTEPSLEETNILTEMDRIYHELQPMITHTLKDLQEEDQADRKPP